VEEPLLTNIEPSQMIVLLALVLVLIFLSALFSGSEVAFFSLKQESLDKIKNKDGLSSKYLIRLLSHPKYLLSTLLIMNNLLNVGVIILTSYLLMGFSNDFTQNPVLRFIVEVVIITSILLLFGEIAPKVYATKKNIQLASLMALPLSFLSYVLTPFNKILVSSTQLIEKRLETKKDNISAEELSQAIDITIDKNTDKNEERKILKGLIEFGNTSVKQIMCNRMNVTALDSKSGFKEILKEVKRCGFSRIPVFEEDIDNIKGIIYSKDLLAHTNEGNKFNWISLTRKPIFVPENKKISKLLKEFQAKKIHLAIIVDEYGGTSGIVTLEDILEEIVGDIKDEYDQEAKAFIKVSEKEFIFDGNFLLSDILKIMEIKPGYFDDEKGDADSIGGLILEINGNMPDFRQKISYKDYSMTIESVGRKSINRVRLVREA
jgi:gliding motility-associated protein GldE